MGKRNFWKDFGGGPRQSAAEQAEIRPKRLPGLVAALASSLLVVFLTFLFLAAAPAIFGPAPDLANLTAEPSVAETVASFVETGRAQVARAFSELPPSKFVLALAILFLLVFLTSLALTVLLLEAFVRGRNY